MFRVSMCDISMYSVQNGVKADNNFAILSTSSMCIFEYNVFYMGSYMYIFISALNRI